jgi:hypothetical protein
MGDVELEIGQVEAPSTSPSPGRAKYGRLDRQEATKVIFIFHFPLKNNTTYVFKNYFQPTKIMLGRQFAILIVWMKRAKLLILSKT